MAYSKNRLLMNETSLQLENLLYEGQAYFLRTSGEHLELKPSENKWSKKEILGHLIDSGINNLVRFTEIQFEKTPYEIRKYNQDAWVKANDYQNANLNELLSFWMAVNRRILEVIKNLSPELLGSPVSIDNRQADLRFLIEDYVNHLYHHLRQITREELL